MVRERESKKFQEHMAASFSKIQLEGVQSWLETNVHSSKGSNFLKDFSRALETVEFDEKGKIMDEEGKQRIRYGLAVITRLRREHKDISTIQGRVQVWQLSPDENDIQVRLPTPDRRRRLF